MNILKKQLAIISFVAAVLIIGITWYQIYMSKEQDNFILKNIYGEPSVLDSLLLSGELRDGFHRTQFSLHGNELDSKTEVFSIPHYAHQGRNIAGLAKTINGLEYEVHGTFNDYEIRYFSRDPRNSMSGKAKVNTALRYEGPRQKHVSHYTNVTEYGLAEAGGKIYFAVPTTRDYTGNHGIYELDWQEQTSHQIVTIPLDQNNDENALGLDVLGLESVGDKLALITVENNQLVVKGYDASGRSLGEAVVPDFTIPRYGEQPAEPSHAEVHREAYEVFSDDEERLLILSFYSYHSTDEAVRKTIVIIDFSADVARIETVKASFQNDNSGRYNGFSYMNYLDGKLIVVNTASVEHEFIRLAQDLYDQLNIYVYAAGELMYHGVLITDKNDDLIRLMHRSDGYGYNTWEHRHYDQIRVKRND